MSRLIERKPCSARGVSLYSLRCSLGCFLISLLLFVGTLLPLHGFLHHDCHSNTGMVVFEGAVDFDVQIGEPILCSLCLLLRSYQGTIPVETVLVPSGESTRSVCEQVVSRWIPQIPGKGRSPPTPLTISI